MKHRLWLSCYLLLLPTMLLLFTFSFVPIAWAFWMSLYEFEIGGASQFVGLDNYWTYLTDPTLVLSFANMAFLALFAITANTVIPLILARLVFSLRSERARHFYRVVFLAPIVVPLVATQLIWGTMILGEFGALNGFLGFVGLEEWQRPWLQHPDTALYSLAIIGFPFANGIHILIFYAGLASIPTSVREAAVLDGATGVTQLLYIDLPLLLSQVRLLVVITTIGAVQGFENILILTRGGPGFETMVPGLWMYYNAFSFQRMGVACAIGVVLFFLILMLTMLNFWAIKSSEAIQGERP